MTHPDADALRRSLADACDRYAEAGADREAGMRALVDANAAAVQLARALVLEDNLAAAVGWPATRDRLLAGALATALD